jgi:hypothetical protein
MITVVISGARGLVRIRTLACGAGDPGFKSPRARHKLDLFGCASESGPVAWSSRHWMIGRK